MKREPRLQFTDAERADPELEKPIRKAEKAAAKADAAQAKIPKKTVKVKERAVDAATGKVATRLKFEEIDKKKPPSKLSHHLRDTPGQTVAGTLHREIAKREDENVGVESGHKLEEAAETGGRIVQSGYRSHKLKPYRKAAAAEHRLEKANVNVLYHKSLWENPQLASNPLSRWQQKQAIKKQYAAAKSTGQAATGTAKAAGNTARAAKKAAKKSEQAAGFAWRHKKGVGIAVALFLIVCFLLNGLTSCSMVFQTVLAGLSGTTYPSKDEDLLAVEREYVSMELALQNRIGNIESERPGYDEYRYDIGEIGHNPHELASCLSAVFHEYTLGEVAAELERIFGLQYELSLVEEVEVRYRTETRTDADGNDYDVEVPYNYYILNVTLTSRPIGAFVPEILDTGQLEQYRVYLASSGNRPLLFGGGTADSSPSEDLSGVHFVDGTRPGNPQVVSIAQSQVGNVGGQPYWSWYGFESRVEWCACFVSWCYAQAGYSEPRFSGCTSGGMAWFQSHGQWGDRNCSDIAPGDAIFFDWDNSGDADHVGIVIGTDGERVYTVEGNSGDACKIKSYPLGSSVIRGYGLMN